MTQGFAKTLQRLEMHGTAMILALNHGIHLSLPTSRLWDSHLSLYAISLTLSLTHLCLSHAVTMLISALQPTKSSKRSAEPHFATAALSTWVLKNPPFVRSMACW